MGLQSEIYCNLQLIHNPLTLFFIFFYLAVFLVNVSRCVHKVVSMERAHLQETASATSALSGTTAPLSAAVTNTVTVRAPADRTSVCSATITP